MYLWFRQVAAQEDLECKVVELSQDLRDSRGDIAILTTQLRDMETKNSVQMEEKLQLQKKVAEEAQTVEVSTWYLLQIKPIILKFWDLS